MRYGTGLAWMIAVAVATPAAAAEAKREAAGRLRDGTVVEAVTLSNRAGVSARILTYGATLQSLVAPDRQGRPADVTLGYDDAATYESTPNYFGVTVGRYANRIAGGRFVLDGKPYQLEVNNPPNALHGGTVGFDKRNWRVVSVRGGTTARVMMVLTSADGDQGYPGKLDVTVTYSLDEGGALTIAFEGRANRPTIVNMTNHAIFNLGGTGVPDDVSAHCLTVPAATYTPVDANLIPTGERRAVAGTVFDFRAPRALGGGMRDGGEPQIRVATGYDHNFALDKGLTREPQLAARLEDPVSGRVLEVLTTEPGIQVYSGNFLDGKTPGKGGRLYRMGDGVALEPQKFPDAPNQPSFVSARVDPGKPYRHVMVYRMSVAR